MTHIHLPNLQWAYGALASACITLIVPAAAATLCPVDDVNNVETVESNIWACMQSSMFTIPLSPPERLENNFASPEIRRLRAVTAVPAQIALVDFENAPDFQFGAAPVALLGPSAFDGCDERGRVLLQRRVHRVDRG